MLPPDALGALARSLFASRFIARPAVLIFLREADLREDSVAELLDEIGDRLGLVVEGGHGGHYRGAGVVNSQRIFEMDAVERRFPQAENERTPFFQADVGGAG